jgi:hypothetical protein
MTKKNNDNRRNIKVETIKTKLMQLQTTKQPINDKAKKKFKSILKTMIVKSMQKQSIIPNNQNNPVDEITTNQIPNNQNNPVDQITTNQIPNNQNNTVDQITTNQIPNNQHNTLDQITTNQIPNNQNNTVDQITLRIANLGIADLGGIKTLMHDSYSIQENQLENNEHSIDSSEGDLNMENTQKSPKQQFKGTSWEQTIKNEEHFGDLTSLFHK